MDQESVLNSIYDGVMVVDGQGAITFVNPGYERIFRVQAEKVVGKPLMEIEPTSVVLDVLKTRKPLIDYPTRVVSAGVDIVTNVTPVIEEGHMCGVVAIFRDATEMFALKEQTTRYLAELRELRHRFLETDDLVSGSPQMQRILELARRIALVDSTVLLTGESGVGKERIAKLIHRVSPRREAPLIVINCGAIPEYLMESELFGYEKNAFTGASPKGKVGLLEVANGGTLLFDEIGDLSGSLQVKLLRAIQEQQFMRVGGVTPISVNVRFIAATNRDLHTMVKERSFREDLFYRLNVVSIRIPPLRERRSDIPRLTQVFLNNFNSKYHSMKRLTPEVLQFFEKSYDWPGNIRELENVVERLTVSSSDNTIGLLDPVLTDYFSLGRDLKRGFVVNELMPLREGTEMLEKELISRALAQYGSARGASKILGVDHSTITRKARKYGLRHHEN